MNWQLPPDYGEPYSYTYDGIMAQTRADDEARAHLADLRDNARALGLTITENGAYDLTDAKSGRLVIRLHSLDAVQAWLNGEQLAREASGEPDYGGAFDGIGTVYSDADGGL